MTTTDDILKDIYIECPLYGEVLINCTRYESNSYNFIAAVSGKLELFVNPEKMSEFTTKQKKAIIIHEIMHLIMQHHQRFSNVFAKTRLISNYAMDCAINQLIPNLPKDCITLDTIKLLTKNANLEALQPAEYYYRHLMKAYEEYKSGMGNGSGNAGWEIDDNEAHDKLFEGDLTPFEEALLSEVIDKAIESQKQHNLKHGTEAGNNILNVIPQREKCIDKNLWKSAISRNFGEYPNGKHEYRCGVQSRRNIDSTYGKKQILESTSIYVGLDTSGSVSDDILTKFISQINAGMKSNDCSITLIQCDAAVSDVKKVKRIPATGGFKVVGRGGTDLTNITKWIKENRPKSEKKSYLILLTDGATPWNVEESIQTTVIYTPNHEKIPGVHLSAVLSY